MTKRRPVVKLRGETRQTIDDELAVEEPLEIRVRGRAVAVTMRTPGPPGTPGSSDRHADEDAELAAGFFYSEGVIRSADDITRIEPCARPNGDNVVNVFLAPQVELDFDRLTRHVFSSSSCGVCGKATIESLQHDHEPVTSDITIHRNQLHALPARLRQAQPGFDRTGGLHAAALFDHEGNLLIAREDVGRHNAVDKAVGHSLLNRSLPLDRHTLLVSGRASFEIIQKALAARVPVVAAVGAPSSLAVDLAEASGITLVGFLTEDRMNIYTHKQRVIG